jgi:hypothetical protein
MLVVATTPSLLRAQQPEPPGQLIREVVYNELHDHDTHGFWRYWIEQHVQSAIRLQEQVETADGPITRLIETDGHPVDAQTRDEENAKLEHLVSSPRERASHRQNYVQDEKHVALVMSLLPDAYLFEYVGDENGCLHLRYHPNPAYAARSIEARVIHSMTGDLWVNMRFKRLARLEGHLNDNVDFGFGLLGRLDKGGWFSMQRLQVSPIEWKTERLEVHMSGRAFMLKTIGRETNELRGGFVAVPAGISVAQGMHILDQTDPLSPPNTMAHISPASLGKRR